MIYYDFGMLGVGFMCRWSGSVSRKALIWAVPTVALTILAHYLYYDVWDVEWWTDASASQLWASYNFTLGFLLVFRSQQAYGRYWEGATFLQQVRGEWFNATSSLVAFCTDDVTKSKEVESFQHLLVRLVSLLYCSGLRMISDLPDGHFEVLDVEGIDEASLIHLDSSTEKCEIVLQWIQRLTMDSTRKGIVSAPPPIVSRVFQELSRGVVNLNNARKIADIPFPFPYAQMATIMLVIHWVVAPVVSVIILRSRGWACVLAFISVWAMWGINYIAAEIEAPFGSDQNDLPLTAMMMDMNVSLWTLLDQRTQLPPTFNFEKRKHRRFKSIAHKRSKLNDIAKNLTGGRATSFNAPSVAEYDYSRRSLDLESSLSVNEHIEGFTKDLADVTDTDGRGEGDSCSLASINDIPQPFHCRQMSPFKSRSSTRSYRGSANSRSKSSIARSSIFSRVSSAFFGDSKQERHSRGVHSSASAPVSLEETIGGRHTHFGKAEGAMSSITSVQSQMDTNPSSNPSSRNPFRPSTSIQSQDASLSSRIPFRESSATDKRFSSGSSPDLPTQNNLEQKMHELGELWETQFKSALHDLTQISLAPRFKELGAVWEKQIEKTVRERGVPIKEGIDLHRTRARTDSSSLPFYSSVHSASEHSRHQCSVHSVQTSSLHSSPRSRDKNQQQLDQEVFEQRLDQAMAHIPCKSGASRGIKKRCHSPIAEESLEVAERSHGDLRFLATDATHNECRFVAVNSACLPEPRG